MVGNTVRLTISNVGSGLDDDEREQLLLRMRSDLLDADVDVRLSGGDALPRGAKAIEPVVTGIEILVAAGMHVWVTHYVDSKREKLHNAILSVRGEKTEVSVDLSTVTANELIGMLEAAAETGSPRTGGAKR